MSISVFKKWTSAVLYLDEKIKNNRLIAGRNIQLENTGNGIRIHGSASSNPANNGDTYNGYFKVIQTDTGYSVVYGADPDAFNCGRVNAGNTRIAVPKKDFITADVSANGYFYIETTYTSPDYASVIKFASALPEAEDGKDICLVANLKDTTPIQILHGEHFIVRWV